MILEDIHGLFKRLDKAAVTDIARKQDAHGFDENKTAARKGGTLPEEPAKNWRQKELQKSFHLKII